MTIAVPMYAMMLVASLMSIIGLTAALKNIENKREYERYVMKMGKSIKRISDTMLVKVKHSFTRLNDLDADGYPLAATESLTEHSNKNEFRSDVL